MVIFKKTTTNMNNLKILALSMLAVSLILTSACSQKKQNEKVADTADSVKVVSVRTQQVAEEIINKTIYYTSSLLPSEEIHLAPASPGRIEKIYAEVSDFVPQGKVLVQMDRTQLQQAKINMLTLETDFKRMDTLRKTGSIPEQQYDQLKSRYEIAKSSYEFLQENTQLKAPFSGYVSGKYFEDGEMYSGSPVAAIGKPAVLSIIQINTLKAQVNISAMYFPIVHLGMKTEIVSELYPDKTFSGKISNIYPTIDNATKTFVVEIQVQNNNLKLRPGMFAKIRLDLGKGSAIMVPTIALIKQTGTNDMYAFVNENNVAIKKSVKVGAIINDRAEVVEGLNIGDELIVIGQNKLENKTPITITK